MGEEIYKNEILTEECGACFLCEDAGCTKACPHGIKTDEIIRSVRFENIAGAASKLPKELPCKNCQERFCQTACVKNKLGKPVEVSRVMELCAGIEKIPEREVDLSIEFCGLKCENPFFLSSSVVGSGYDMIAKAFDMGWAGVVYKTVTSFPHDEVSPRFAAMKKENTPFVGFKNLEQSSEKELKENLAILKKLKGDYPNKIIVGSIMGQSEEDWTYLAKVMTEAGVDMLECNFSCPHMAFDGVGSDVGQDPELVAKYVKAVKRGTSLPVLAKMTPNTGNMVPPAAAAMEAGADGLAAINTIKSLMNVDMSSFVSQPEVAGQTSVGGYSGKAVKPIACRFIYDMASAKELKNAPISGMGGIETWKDAVEFLALGCTNIQVTTAVMQYGYRIIEDMIDGTKRILAANGYNSITEIVGKALPKIVPTEDLERQSICYPKFYRERCVGCGRCYVSCYDGGHQALKMKDGHVTMDAKKCVGCHLCLTVCPVEAIGVGPRVPINK